MDLELSNHSTEYGQGNRKLRSREVCRDVSVEALKRIDDIGGLRTILDAIRSKNQEALDAILFIAGEYERKWYMHDPDTDKYLYTTTDRAPRVRFFGVFEEAQGKGK